MVSPVMGTTHLTKVLMNGGSAVNILYANASIGWAFHGAACVPIASMPFFGIVLKT